MATCKICSQNLTVELDAESFDEATSSAVGVAQSFPDDLLLSCGCHFHWQCLLDESPRIVLSKECPSCTSTIMLAPAGSSSTSSTSPSRSQQPQVLTWYHNEGGVQENLDIFPLITEEAFLDANPAARPARALMTMCSEGDVSGIVELLRAIEEDRDEEDMSPAALIRYQDPLDGRKTGLHVAVENEQLEVMWLILWLASSLKTTDFSEEVARAAQLMGAGRDTEGVDIRSFRDAEDRTAEDIARGMAGRAGGGSRGAWAGLLASKILKG